MALAALPNAVEAGISDDIHNRCKNVTDFSGCVETYRKYKNSETEKKSKKFSQSCNEIFSHFSDFDNCIGEWSWPNGDSYNGGYSKGLKHGKGIYKWGHGDTFEGEYYLDKRKNGKYVHANGDVYIGEFKNSARWGKGTFYWTKLGEKFVGDWVDDKRTGQGVYTWSNGRSFKGPFIADEAQWDQGVLSDNENELGISEGIENTECSEERKDYKYTSKTGGGFLRKSKLKTITLRCLSNSEIAEIKTGLTDLNIAKKKARSKQFLKALLLIGNAYSNGKAVQQHRTNQNYQMQNTYYQIDNMHRTGSFDP